jgi:hypothetical protein
MRTRSKSPPGQFDLGERVRFGVAISIRGGLRVPLTAIEVGNKLEVNVYESYYWLGRGLAKVRSRRKTSDGGTDCVAKLLAGDTAEARRWRRSGIRR